MSGMYHCKYCGRSFASLNSLTVEVCLKSPGGYHEALQDDEQKDGTNSPHGEQNSPFLKLRSSSVFMGFIFILTLMIFCVFGLNLICLIKIIFKFHIGAVTYWVLSILSSISFFFAVLLIRMDFKKAVILTLSINLAVIAVDLFTFYVIHTSFMPTLLSMLSDIEYGL